MTTIPEMDEFFDFDEATNLQMLASPYNNTQPHGLASPSMYDIDLMLAQQANDDLNSFHSLQDFIDPRLEAGTCLYDPTTPSGQPKSQTDGFAYWMGGAEGHVTPCAYCRYHKLECFLIDSSGSTNPSTCTNCVAVSRNCSLADENAIIEQGMSLDRRFDEWMGSLQTVRPEDAPVEMMGNSQAPISNHRSSTRSSPKESSENLNKSTARFSRETVRILRNWASVHYKHPYPTEAEKEDLKRRTGLNKIQITNWLANARRRGLVKPSRSKSPSTHNPSLPIDVPAAGSGPLKNMNPMERWQNSPPEHEPASEAAIAHAVTSSHFLPGQDSPYSYPRSENGSVHSVVRVSSASSINTAHSSGGSLGSTFSQQSRGSFGAFGKRGRRRRRHTATVTHVVIPHKPQRQYQCTFCIESFKTKHDWQRHEKSLHLSLERWICAPSGGIVPCQVQKLAGENLLICVFCGSSNPDEVHLETHNYVSCLDRSLEERTFYRKDHLRQHLRLVHGECKFITQTMESWKVESPNIKSRCGFCGDILETWPSRVDHLAEHFKAGMNMTEWKGAWGFDNQILNMVENATSPHIVHGTTEEEVKESLDQYDKVKAGLIDFANEQALLGNELTNSMLKAEGRRIILDGADVESPASMRVKSWFEDLFLASETPKFAGSTQIPHEGSNENFLIGEHSELLSEQKRCHKENCDLERELMTYVKHQRGMGLIPTDEDLQAQCCRVIGEHDQMNGIVKSVTAVRLLVQLVMSSTFWLHAFRYRAGISQNPLISNMGQSNAPSPNSSHSYKSLENKVAEFTMQRQRQGSSPSDDEPQIHTHLTNSGFNDTWDHALTDDPNWLASFQRVHDPTASGISNVSNITKSSQYTPTEVWGSTYLANQLATPEPGLEHLSPNELAYVQKHGIENLQSYATTRAGKPIPLYSLTDAKFYYRLELELSQYVFSCISPNGPNSHIPSDEELKHRARLILYNDDCPWNQTAMDNAEWLLRFKRSHGLANPKDGPGLPRPSPESEVSFGATGATRLNIPAYFDQKSQPQSQTGFAQQRITVPTVFFSWELEAGLTAYTRSCISQSYIPSDDDLRARARLIVGESETSADEPQLLDQFKNIYGVNSLHQSSPGFDSHGVDFSSLDLPQHIDQMEMDEPLEGLHFLDFNSHAQGLTPRSDYDRITSLPSDHARNPHSHSHRSSHSSVSRTSSNSSSNRPSPLRRPLTPKPVQLPANNSITRNITCSLSNNLQSIIRTPKGERTSFAGAIDRNLLNVGGFDKAPRGSMVSSDDILMVDGVAQAIDTSGVTAGFGWDNWRVACRRVE